MRSLLYHCPAGICGDMNLGAMIALGVAVEDLERELRKLPLTGWQLRVEADERLGIAGMRCDVLVEAAQASTHAHAHAHADGEGHSHSHSHEHRHFAEIREMIEASDLAARVKSNALACFQVLAEAEAAVHGVAVEAVHFHEVGAVDSIVDMVGAAICWDLLGVTDVLCSTREVGGGTVQCAHGRMPVPAPATARLLKGMAVSYGGTDKEATTPTGAALLAGMQCRFAERVAGTCVATGVGVGDREDSRLANVLYVSLIEGEDAALPARGLEQDAVWELAVNLDDMTAEAEAFLTEALLDRGALDVWQTPAVFKKGRLGKVVSVLVPESERGAVRAAFFEHSRTLGVREQLWQRSKLKRQVVEVATPWGTVRVKQSGVGTSWARQKVDFDDCQRVAQEQGWSLAQVQERLQEWMPELKEGGA